MSLVAYGSSSDDSSEDEEPPKNSGTKTTITTDLVENHNPTKLCLPTPKYKSEAKDTPERTPHSFPPPGEESLTENHSALFNSLPKPKSLEPSNSSSDILEEDDDIPVKKPSEVPAVKQPTKKDRPPVRITVPSLSDFKDVEEQNGNHQNKVQASEKGMGLFAILPPPKGAMTKSTKNLVPHVLTKPSKPPIQSKACPKPVPPSPKVQKSNPTPVNYDSNSEDENDSSFDFFSLSKTTPKPVENIEMYPLPPIEDKPKKMDPETTIEKSMDKSDNKVLVSNVMNLPKQEVILKNKAEVGPKLPVPEQEYNVDPEGNVAFDEKAIEYLCGRRGVKRKDKFIDEANIIEINGEDIKPDEREWLVKALTEEPVSRPVSMQSAGPSNQSKKKHQITYLAHQAKAMEVELKNQWAQNRMTRKQTQSKYGF